VPAGVFLLPGELSTNISGGFLVVGGTNWVAHQPLPGEVQSARPRIGWLLTLSARTRSLARERLATSTLQFLERISLVQWLVLTSRRACVMTSEGYQRGFWWG